MREFTLWGETKEKKHGITVVSHISDCHWIAIWTAGITVQAHWLGLPQTRGFRNKLSYSISASVTPKRHSIQSLSLEG